MYAKLGGLSYCRSQETKAHRWRIRMHTIRSSFASGDRRRRLPVGAIRIREKPMLYFGGLHRRKRSAYSRVCALQEQRVACALAVSNICRAVLMYRGSSP